MNVNAKIYQFPQYFRIISFSFLNFNIILDAIIQAKYFYNNLN